MNHMCKVCVAHNPDLAIIHEKSEELARKLNLPLCSGENLVAAGFCLAYTEVGLELRECCAHDGKSRCSSLRADFLGGSAGYRFSHNCTIRQPLAKAVGIKPGFRPELWALLADGLERAGQSHKTASIITNHLQLVSIDAKEYLSSCTKPPHTVYLDPMYPHSSKTALNKIEMRIIRTLVGDDTDSDDLLTLALQRAGNRVVVKRPKTAPHLGDKAPTHSVHMKNSRFDVYLTHL
jgi:16S rRNA (guanine1516-N2)-methyltransferase